MTPTLSESVARVRALHDKALQRIESVRVLRERTHKQGFAFDGEIRRIDQLPLLQAEADSIANVLRVVSAWNAVVAVMALEQSIAEDIGNEAIAQFDKLAEVAK